MRFQDLRTGDLFIFDDTYGTGPGVYEYRGNHWYGKPYTGGPWHRYDNPIVFLATAEQRNTYHEECEALFAMYSPPKQDTLLSVIDGIVAEHESEVLAS